jgi:hypothetical protein
VVSADATTLDWSSPVAVADDGTIAKAIVDAGTFYVVWTPPSGTGIYLLHIGERRRRYWQGRWQYLDDASQAIRH